MSTHSVSHTPTSGGCQRLAEAEGVFHTEANLHAPLPQSPVRLSVSRRKSPIPFSSFYTTIWPMVPTSKLASSG